MRGDEEEEGEVIAEARAGGERQRHEGAEAGPGGAVLQQGGGAVVGRVAHPQLEVVGRDALEQRRQSTAQRIADMDLRAGDAGLADAGDFWEQLQAAELGMGAQAGGGGEEGACATGGVHHGQGAIAELSEGELQGALHEGRGGVEGAEREPVET